MKRQKKATAQRKLSPRQVVVNQALQLTWELKGRLKSFQMYYLRIGAMLARARDEKMFSALAHPDIEDYAEKRLNLGRTTLYRYLQVYDWARTSHPEWLVEHPKGHIPDLSDVGDLIWIEARLAAKDLAADTRAKLEALRARAMDGTLRQRDLREFRKKSTQARDPLKAYLSQLLALRRKGLRVKSLPAEAITKLEGVIEVVQQTIAVRKTGESLDRAA